MEDNITKELKKILPRYLNYRRNAESYADIWDELVLEATNLHRLGLAEVTACRKVAHDLHLPEDYGVSDAMDILFYHYKEEAVQEMWENHYFDRIHKTLISSEEIVSWANEIKQKAKY